MQISNSKAFKIFKTGLKNYFLDKPICLSFEVLHSCNLNCHHCNWGGLLQENLMTAEEIKSYYLKYDPCVVQISGGEPLLRDDLEDICSAVKKDNDMPFLMLVSNWSLMTEERYLNLRESGVDQFVVSLDFPDERHDYNRREPGLFEHMSELIPKVAALGHDDIVTNTAITHENFQYLREVVELVERWGVYCSFSAYTVLRTANRDFSINGKEDLALLRKIIDELIQLKQEHRNIATAEHTLERTFDFFRDGKISGCKAGKRFMVVTPSGLLLPCAMHREKHFETQDEMIKIFSDHNKCGSCYVSIRAFTDKNFFALLKASISSWLAIRKSSSENGRTTPIVDEVLGTITE